MLFLHWFDDSKRPADAKLADACAAYTRRFGAPPNVALVNEADAGAQADGVEVRVTGRIGKHNYQVGRDG
jgi:hypothetical protein